MQKGEFFLFILILPFFLIYYLEFVCEEIFFINQAHLLTLRNSFYGKGSIKAYCLFSLIVSFQNQGLVLYSKAQ